MDGRWDTPENSSRQLLFGTQWSTKHVSWGYFWIMATSGFDFTVSAVVQQYSASFEQAQAFLLAFELVTIPPEDGLFSQLRVKWRCDWSLS